MDLKKDNIFVDFKIGCLDLSSSCVGYTIAEIKSDSTAVISQAGIIKWTKDVPKEKKYFDMYNIISDIWYANNIDFVVIERFSFNPKQCMGALVVPEMIGAVKAATYSNLPPMEIEIVPPQTWKKALTDNGRAKKDEVELAIRRKFPDKFPEKIANPVTGNQIKIPSDLFDSIGICLWFLTKKYLVKTIDFEAKIK